MSIERTTILKGPGYISVSGASIHSTDDIVATRVEEWSDKITSGFARTGRSLLNRYVEVVATPAMWANLATLFPLASAQPWDTLYGDTDVPLIITPRNGRTLTVVNSAITQLANLKLATKSPLFKSAIKWTGLVANNSSAGSLANFYVQGLTVGSNVVLPGFDPTKMQQRRYSALRNAIAIRGDDGFDIDFAMSLEPDKPDGEPIVNYRLKSIDATVKTRPVGMTEADYATLMGDGVDIGDEPPVYDLAIAGATSGDPKFTLANTHVEPGSFAYGAANRNGELTF
ncbi:MAG: hypothetical protein WC661_21370, partial [Opitutaceae bacterium]